MGTSSCVGVVFVFLSVGLCPRLGEVTGVPTMKVGKLWWYSEDIYPLTPTVSPSVDGFRLVGPSS